MNTVFGSSTFLYPNGTSSGARLWGCFVTLPSLNNSCVSVPEPRFCPKCNSILLPQNSNCPICDPKSFYSATGKGMISMEVMIGQSKLLKERNLCIAFDLSIRGDVLAQIVYVVMSPSFRSRFSGFRFSVCFIGQEPIFVTSTGGVIDLAFGKVFDERSELFFGVDELGAVIEDVFAMLNSMALPGTNLNSFATLFDVMSKQSLLAMFLFHFAELPKCDDEFPFSMNVIEVKPLESESRSLLQSLQNGWTHCSMQQCDSELEGYMYNLIAKVCSSSIKLIAKVSNGLEFSWVCGPKQEKVVQGDRIETTFRNYASNLMVAVALQPSSKFSSASFFSIQTIHQYDNEFALVSNRCWKKATTASEWAESFNVVYLCSLVLKQMAAYTLGTFTKKPKFRLFSSNKYVWDLSALPNEPSTIQFARKACKLFKELIVSDSSPIPVHIRQDLLFLTMTQGHFYLGYLAGCLMMVASGQEILHLPPYILVPMDSVESSVSKDTNFHIVSTKVFFSRENFEQIRQIISTIVK